MTGKRIWLPALLLAALLTACVPVELPGTARAVFTGKIVQRTEDTLLLAGTGETADGLYTVSVKDAAITDREGRSVDAEVLQSGVPVEIPFSGQVMESWPAQLGQIRKVRVAGPADDRVGLYRQVIDDLYRDDPGLNEGISLLAIDLAGASDLSGGEKQAVIYLSRDRYGLDTRLATFDELCQEGLINREELRFDTGLLFTISDVEESEQELRFTAEKWRSGTGALIYSNCAAVCRDGQWTYSAGGIGMA